LSVSVVDGDDDLEAAERAMLDAEEELRLFGTTYHEHLASRHDAAEMAKRAYRDLAQRLRTVPVGAVTDGARPG
jgi:hypothetical protein